MPMMIYNAGYYTYNSIGDIWCQCDALWNHDLRAAGDMLGRAWRNVENRGSYVEEMGLLCGFVQPERPPHQIIQVAC